MEIKSLDYGGIGNVAGQVSSVQPAARSDAPENTDSSDDNMVVSEATQTQSVQETQKQPDSNSEKKNDSDSREATDEQIWQAVSEINKRANETEAIFGIHEKTNRITIKIVDKKSKDVIREVPAEKTLDLIAKAWELAGLLVDEKR